MLKYVFFEIFDISADYSQFSSSNNLVESSYAETFLKYHLCICFYIRWNSYHHNVFLDIVQNFAWNDVDEALKFAFVSKNWLLNKEQLSSL